MIKNQLKTVILLGALTAVLLLIGAYFGRQGLTIAFAFAIIMNLVSYFYSHKIVLAMYRAKEAKENDYPDLFKIVREISHLANVPMPKVYIMPTATPNAFATGRNPKNGVVAVTQGILDLLNKDELKGVIAHEFAHIKNRDILIQTIAATIAAVIAYAAFMARWAAIFGGYGRDSEGGGNMFELLALAILAPLTATIIQLAISRSREYLADESGSRFIHSQHGLINALQKLEAGVKNNPLRFGNQQTSSLFIVNPFSAQGFTNLFSTHPPVALRVKKLQKMKI